MPEKLQLTLEQRVSNARENLSALRSPAGAGETALRRKIEDILLSSIFKNSQFDAELADRIFDVVMVYWSVLERGSLDPYKTIAEVADAATRLSKVLAALPPSALVGEGRTMHPLPNALPPMIGDAPWAGAGARDGFYT
jgi:hypothetical protein